jgi:metal-dependent HD superfamily phosphatase/phosphodiesterase
MREVPNWSVLASLLHDLGVTTRTITPACSGNNILQKLTSSGGDMTIVTSEVLHAIIAHRSGGRPYTLRLASCERLMPR